MIDLHVSKMDEGQRLNKYLMKYLNDAPASFIYKMIRKKNIVMNNKRVKGDEIIHEADVISLYLSDETISKFQKNKAVKNTDIKAKGNTKGNKLQVLYQDDDIMAIHKPAGVLSQKASAGDYSINECLIDYCKNNHVISDEAFLTFTPSVCNRLDRNTSGIILAGISLKGSQFLSETLKKRTSDKFYYTVVFGEMTKGIHEIAYISKDRSANKSSIISEAEYKCLSPDVSNDYTRIETAFEPLFVKNGYSLIKVKLITGKSHQIRAHLRQLGFYVVGDTKYGNVKINTIMRDRYKLKHHLLHAGEVIIPDYRGDELVIKDKLPEQFKSICMGLGLSIDNI